jgi:hypothetical protein
MDPPYYPPWHREQSTVIARHDITVKLKLAPRDRAKEVVDPMLNRAGGQAVLRL